MLVGSRLNVMTDQIIINIAIIFTITLSLGGGGGAGVYGTIYIASVILWH